MGNWAGKWGILRSDGSYSFIEYLESVCKVASTSNGVLGLRIMWETMAELCTNIAFSSPDKYMHDFELLEQTFKSIKLIYLFREDVVGQAISLLRAEQSNYWHSTEGSALRVNSSFDFEGIALRVEMLIEHNKAWEQWFEKQDVEPFRLRYEDFEADPKCQTKHALQFLGLELPCDIELSAPNKRLADKTTVTWKERYYNEKQNAN